MSSNNLKKHFFWKYAFIKDGLFSERGSFSYDGLMSAIRLFYAFMLYFVFLLFTKDLQKLASNYPNSPIWPIKLLHVFIRHEYVPYGIGLGLFLSTIIAVLFIEKRTTRIFVFLFYFLFVAYNSSYGKINHNYHHLVYLLFGLIFLPSKMNNNHLLKTKVVFSSIQLFILFTYSISGFWKLNKGLAQFFKDEESIFSVNSLSNHIAKRIMETNQDTLFGEWLINQPHLGFLLLLSAVYVELCSVFILFRPSIHRFWGISLILMHFNIYIFMGIGFTSPCIVLAFLFLTSPFADKKFNLRKTLTSLPLFGSIISSFLFFIQRKRKNIILFYDGECGVCNYFVQFLLKNKVRNISFAPIGGEHYQKTFSDETSYQEIDTIIIHDVNETKIRSQAIIRAISLSQSSLRFLAYFLALVPSEIADVLYIGFAKIRKRIIKNNSCNLLTHEQRQLFLN